MGGQSMALQLSKGEVEIAELFWDIGLKKNTARVLVLMIRDVDLTSREMERACDLRQPEVSIALTDLLKRKWIKNIRQVMENKGRPVKIYHLSRTLEDILDDLKGAIVDDYGRKVLEIERVRELLKTQ
jgi:predicted transcriptional regulator